MTERQPAMTDTGGLFCAQQRILRVHKKEKKTKTRGQIKPYARDKYSGYRGYHKT